MRALVVARAKPMAEPSAGISGAGGKEGDDDAGGSSLLALQEESDYTVPGDMLAETTDYVDHTFNGIMVSACRSV